MRTKRIDEIELYDVEAVDEILSHLSDEDANVVQRAISSLCGMITIRDKYIKIRVKYDGTQYAIINALKTLYTISYA